MIYPTSHLWHMQNSVINDNHQQEYQEQQPAQEPARIKDVDETVAYAVISVFLIIVIVVTFAGIIYSFRGKK